MKIAFFTPLQPVLSGISDYAEEILSALVTQRGAGDEITLVVDGYTPTNTTLTSRFRMIPDANYNASDFDLALYQMGNSPAHAYMYRRALREPGVIVLHDLVLHHLIAWLTMNHGDHTSYIEAMRAEYGEPGAHGAVREILGFEPLNRFDYPLSEQVLRSARGVMVHSRYVSNAVQKMAPGVPVAIIPMGIPDVPFISMQEARAHLHLPLDIPLIGTFGIIGPAKRTPVLLDAFRSVRQKVPNARLLMVGGASPNFDVDGLLNVLDVRDAVDVLGHVPFDDFHTYMGAMDVCVNLRYPTAGETSGAVYRMMAQARPVVVSRVGWFAELPDNAVAKIDVDDSETEMLRVTLVRLFQDAPLRAAMGENGRRFTEENCSLDDAARAYLEFMHAVNDGRAQSTSYLKATHDERRATISTVNSATKESTLENAMPVAPSYSVTPLTIPNPPTLPRQARDRLFPAKEGGEGFSSAAGAPQGAWATPPNDWRDKVTRAYVELGLDDKDSTLGEVARALTELGLNE